jgi:hypothetical protein
MVLVQVLVQKIVMVIGKASYNVIKVTSQLTRVVIVAKFSLGFYVIGKMDALKLVELVLIY